MKNQRIGVKKMTLKEKLENCLKEAVDHDEAAGLSVLVRQDGKDLCYVSAGKADIASCRPVERDSIFRLYSQSKPITAAAAMILADRGILDLQTEVDRYLPGFRNPRFTDPECASRTLGDRTAGHDRGTVLSGRGPGRTIRGAGV